MSWVKNTSASSRSARCLILRTERTFAVGSLWKPEISSFSQLSCV